MEKKNKIKNYKKNNHLDLEKIISEYSAYIRKIIANMATPSLSSEDKEEIISDTFFILWKNRENLDENKLLSPYIAGIVKNLIKEKSRIININFNIDDYENVISDLQNIDMLCEQREKTLIIKKSINQMKKQDIIIFNLYYDSSRKIKEIAQILNISEFNIKSRLHRIRKKIKKDLEKGGYSHGK